MEIIEISKIIINICLLFSLFIIFISFEVYIKPFQEFGFYCTDYSITMKYKSSTIDTYLLILLSTVAPFILILLCELAKTSSSLSSSFIKIKLFNQKLINIKQFLVNIYINYGYYLTGLLLTTIVTLIGKKTIGRLRPNFIDVCQPDRNPYNSCVSSSSSSSSMIIMPHVNFKCLNKDHLQLQDSRESFPSGHASTSFYSVIFLILFLNKLFKQRLYGICLLIIECSLFSLAFFISLTRIIDNKHHPTDVCAGALLGTIIGLITFYHLNEFYKIKKRNNIKKTIIQNDNNNNNNKESSSSLLNDINNSNNRLL